MPWLTDTRHPFTYLTFTSHSYQYQPHHQPDSQTNASKSLHQLQFLSQPSKPFTNDPKTINLAQSSKSHKVDGSFLSTTFMCIHPHFLKSGIDFFGQNNKTKEIRGLALCCYCLHLHVSLQSSSFSCLCTIGILFRMIFHIPHALVFHLTAHW